MSSVTKVTELLVKYPELFEDEDFYISCGDGWASLLNALLHVINCSLGRYREVQKIKARIEQRGDEIPAWIEKYFKENKHDPYGHFSIVQIKEKFGGLRFYVGFGEMSGELMAKVNGAIQLAESLSYSICEKCGAPGETRSTGYYIRTLCDKCKSLNEH